ncbi:MAG: tetratricopeptide repeat protein [Magnetococcales bacterium]|nr:tetratricopeptide repeat protein [Magnetococcales bacterium]
MKQPVVQRKRPSYLVLPIVLVLLAVLFFAGSLFDDAPEILDTSSDIIGTSSGLLSRGMEAFEEQVARLDGDDSRGQYDAAAREEARNRALERKDNLQQRYNDRARQGVDKARRSQAHARGRERQPDLDSHLKAVKARIRDLSKLLGPYHWEVGLVYGELGLMHFRRKEYARVGPAYERAVAALEKAAAYEETTGEGVFTSRKGHTVKPMKNRLNTLLYSAWSQSASSALRLYDRRALAAAEQMIKRGIIVRDEVRGRLSSDRVRSRPYEALVEVLLAQGKVDEAEVVQYQLNEDDGRTFANRGGSFHTLRNRALMLRKMETFDEAEKIYRNVLRVDIIRHGEYHKRVAQDYGDLAQLYLARGDRATAETWRRRADVIYARLKK